jgi:hypothetical protein
MNKKHWINILLINIVVGLLVLSPFLPGPSLSWSNLIYSGGQVLGLLGVVVIPVGLFWAIKEIKAKKNDNQYQINRGAIILLTIPLTLFVTSMFISSVVRNFSRDFVMYRADRLIQSIDSFKQRKGRYPNALSDLTPEFIAEIPSPFVMGIDQYDYKNQGGSYSILFIKTS